MSGDRMTPTSLNWMKNELKQGDRLSINHVAHNRFIKSLLAQQLMDVLNEQVDLRVHQSSLSQLRNLHRSELNCPSVSSLPCIYYTGKNDPTARKCWDALALSTLSYCSLIGLGTRPL